MALNYHGISESLRDLMPLSANREAFSTTGFKTRWLEAMDRDLVLDNMSLVNVRLIQADREVRSIPEGYYVYLTFEVDVVAYDFTSFEKAATLRDALLGVAEDAVRANKRFHTDIETSSITPLIRFGVLSPQGAGGHIAVATFVVTAEANVEAL